MATDFKSVCALARYHPITGRDAENLTQSSEFKARCANITPRPNCWSHHGELNPRFTDRKSVVLPIDDDGNIEGFCSQVPSNSDGLLSSHQKCIIVSIYFLAVFDYENQMSFQKKL